MSDPRHRLEPDPDDVVPSGPPEQYVEEPEPHIHSGEGPEQWEEESAVSSPQPPTVPAEPEEPDLAE